MQDVEGFVVELAAEHTRCIRFATWESESLTVVVGFQVNGRTDGIFGHVDEDFITLTDVHDEACGGHGGIKQAAVGTNDVKLAVVTKAKVVATFDFAIENAKADELRGRVDFGGDGAIDEFVVAISVHQIKLVRLAEFAAREHEGDIIDAVVPGQCQCGFFRIANDDESSCTVRELRLRHMVQVRVIPIGAGLVFHFERRRPGRACGNDLVRPTVRNCGNMKTVPMRRGIFTNIVRDVHLHDVAFLHDERRAPEFGAIVAHGRRGHTVA